MSSRLGLAGLLAASLCFAMTSGACGGDGDRDDDNKADAGTTTDAGNNNQTDGGVTECPLVTDCSIPACDARSCGNGGICSNGACLEAKQIGDVCTGGSQAAPQGDCDTGMLCGDFAHGVLSFRAGDAVTTCTKQCTQNADCGANGASNNVCIPINQDGSGFCTRGCDPSAADPAADCGSSGAVCSPGLSIGDVCFFDCATDADCQRGTYCTDPGNGVKICTPKPCPENKDCGEGQVCQEVGESSLCMPECPAVACPGSLVCDETTGLCGAHDGTYYGACSSNTDCAEPDDFCVKTSANPGACMQKCTETRVCGGTPEGTECQITITFKGDNAPPNEMVCALPCTDNATCPAGTTCVQPQGAQSKFCLPS